MDFILKGKRLIYSFGELKLARLQRLQTDALDRTATSVGNQVYYRNLTAGNKYRF
jgi:hypothetical protein